MTDLVKRATVSASELKEEEYVHGLARVERLAMWLRPGTVCFLGLTGWRSAIGPSPAGWQRRNIGGRPTYVMPNPSGANAHVRLDELVGHLRTVMAGLPGRPGHRS
jgi:TDG/mug DNA glycosylase family protein